MGSQIFTDLNDKHGHFEYLDTGEPAPTRLQVLFFTGQLCHRYIHGFHLETLELTSTPLMPTGGEGRFRCFRSRSGGTRNLKKMRREQTHLSTKERNKGSEGEKILRRLVSCAKDIYSVVSAIAEWDLKNFFWFLPTHIPTLLILLTSCRFPVCCVK